MKKARHLGSKGLKNYRTRSLVVSSDQPFKANLDGEPYLSDRFELEVIPKGIRLDVHKDVILRGRV